MLGGTECEAVMLTNSWIMLHTRKWQSSTGAISTSSMVSVSMTIEGGGYAHGVPPHIGKSLDGVNDHRGICFMSVIP